MTGVHADTAILVDPGVRGVGLDVDVLVADLRRLGIGPATLVPGLARHPEVLTAAVKGALRQGGVRGAVVVTAEFGRPPISELRMWGEAGGLAPLGVRVVALDFLRARRSPAERSAYAVRMVRSAVASLSGSGTPKAARRRLGDMLSRRGLLSGRATTWVPVPAVDPVACLGTLRCERCVRACPEDALRIQDDVPGAPPVVDASTCTACSRCLDVCPTSALSLDGHDPGTLAQQLQVLLDGGDGAPPPGLVIACESAGGPLHRLGERGGLPGWLVLELACFGGFGSALLLAALAAGARTVQVLPCERCRDQVSLTRELDFTRGLLTALGDVDADRRVGVLAAGGSRLRRAVLAADGLAPLTDGTGTDAMPARHQNRMPPSATQTPAPTAARAVDELRRALDRPGMGRTQRPRVISGEGAPLGILRASDGCTACEVCARTCPTRALSLDTRLGITELVLDPTACTGCGVCAEMCPEAVLDVVKGIDLDLLAGGRVTIAQVTAATCPDCGQSVPNLPLSARLPSLTARLVGRCSRCRQAALVASA